MERVDRDGSETTAEHVSHETIGELISHLLENAALLLRQEIDLARAEIVEKASRVKGGAIKVGAGAVLGVVGVILLAVAAMLGLTLLLSLALNPTAAACIAALIVGAILAGVGAWLFTDGIKQADSQSLAPRRTLDSLKENARWASNQLR